MTTFNEPVADAAETVAVHTTFRRYASPAQVYDWYMTGPSPVHDK